MFLVCHFTLVSLQFFFFSGMSLKIVDWKRTQLFPTFYEYFIDFFLNKVENSVDVSFVHNKGKSAEI